LCTRKKNPLVRDALQRFVVAGGGAGWMRDGAVGCEKKMALLRRFAVVVRGEGDGGGVVDARVKWRGGEKMVAAVVSGASAAR